MILGGKFSSPGSLGSQLGSVWSETVTTTVDFMRATFTAAGANASFAAKAATAQFTAKAASGTFSVLGS